MVSVAQSVRAPGCGPGGRGFESLHSPQFHKLKHPPKTKIFISLYFIKERVLISCFSKRFIEIIGWLFCLALVLSSCTSESSKSGGGSSSSAYQYLYSYNAVNLDGHTIRWESNTIPVYTGGIAGAESAVNRWAGPMNFNFVSAPPSEGVTFNYTSSSPYCGVTTYYYYNSGKLYRAEIKIDTNQNLCRGGLDNTLTHEMGHALGFFGHTSDGTLMDPDGGNGEISKMLRSFMSLLYSSPYGTDINSYLSLTKQLRGGRYQTNGTQTIVGVQY